MFRAPLAAAEDPGAGFGVWNMGTLTEEVHFMSDLCIQLCDPDSESKENYFRLLTKADYCEGMIEGTLTMLTVKTTVWILISWDLVWILISCPSAELFDKINP